MFRRGMGHMYDYFLRAGRDMTDCKRVGPMQLMSEYGVLGPNCLAVHANCLTPLDVALLKRTGTHVVHCPKTHRFFNRATPLLNTWKEQGINVCLGTDSLASNETLSMLDEMQTLGRMFPQMSAQELLALATVTLPPIRPLPLSVPPAFTATLPVPVPLLGEAVVTFSVPPLMVVPPA